MTDIVVEGLDEALAGLANMPKQVRFAASVGMERTMNEAQDAIRGSLASKFTLRRELFVKNTIYRKRPDDWSTRDKLEARVRVNDQRNILEKFEAGGTKTPTGGRQALAIPVAVKRNKSDIVTKANSVKALLANKKAYIRDGKVWLLQGRGKIKTRVLAYVFRKSVPIKKTLGFVDTGKRVIGLRALPNILGAIEVELSRGLDVKTGKNIKYSRNAPGNFANQAGAWGGK